VRQSSGLVDRRSVLSRELRAYEEIRSLYLPGLLQLLSDKKEPISLGFDGDPIEAKLWLPSALSVAEREWACKDGLASIEVQLRIGRCKDSLNGLRHMLRVKARLVLFKNTNVRGQRESGHSRALIDSIHERAKIWVE
jgi:hypothetical protein